MKKNKDYLCDLRLNLAKNNKTPEWTMKELNLVLKHLKNNKSRDPFGYINELFKNDVAGIDLKTAVLKLMNRIKTEQIYPEALEIANISAIYKNKGPKNNFDSYRGIFRVPIFRTILDRLIYNDSYETIEESLSDSNVGARRGRNVRDNIFTLNAITNSIINGNEDPIDIQLFDIEKCFDTLWVEDCVNDLFESGLQNDKLPLLFMENQNAEIAVKTQTGISHRKSIKNIIMQGTVFGSLCCTVSMDKLGQHIYKNHDLIYKYKGKIDIPTLGMVDDVLAVQKCSNETVKQNAVINAFVESKKLKLSKAKCYKIHIDKKLKKRKECAKIKVHEDQMKDTSKQKYLGDIIDISGKNRSNIEDRKNKGYGVVAEILAIIKDIPLGQYKIEIGLKLRQAMLLNMLLFNSEAWHDVTDAEIKILETVDEHLLRALVNGHSKTPLEFLYLESGATPIRFILACRRMIYVQIILKRQENELTKRIYNAQKENPTRGDFFCQVLKDFDVIGEKLDEKEVTKKSKISHKNNIKQKIKTAAFHFLLEKKLNHSKIKDIQYSKLETQSYMTSPLFTNSEVSLLFALRSKYVDCKANFRSKYRNTDLLCEYCSECEDNQQHILRCKVLNKFLKSKDVVDENFEYNDLFKNVKKQKVIVTIYAKLLHIRSQLKTNPSILDKMLERSYDLHSGIVNFSPGN